MVKNHQGFHQKEFTKESTKGIHRGPGQEIHQAQGPRNSPSPGVKKFTKSRGLGLGLGLGQAWAWGGGAGQGGGPGPAQAQAPAQARAPAQAQARGLGEFLGELLCYLVIFIFVLFCFI